MKRIALALFALTLSLPAQQPKEPTDLKALQAENATLRDQVSQLQIENDNLKFSLLQGQATPIISDKQKAIQTLTAAHPGMEWNDAQQKLVPIPPKPAAKPAAPATPPAK